MIIRVHITLFALPFLMANSALCQTFSGADLLNLPNVSFPNQIPIADGDSLVFGPVGTNLEKLMTFSLAPGGVYSIGDTISIRMNLTRTQSDFDPTLALGDGVSLIGFTPADNSGGSAEIGYGNDTGTNLDIQGSSELFNNSGFPNINESFDVAVDFTLFAGSVEVVGLFEGNTGMGSAPISLNLSQPLSFVFVGNNPPEAYRINSLTIVPEPSAIALWTIGLLAFLPMVRSSIRRQARTPHFNPRR